MALALLEDIGADPVVSVIEIARDGQEWSVEADGGEISDASKDKIAFTFTADSLPWVVPEQARQGFEMTNAGHRMSRETLKVEVTMRPLALPVSSASCTAASLTPALSQRSTSS